MPTPEFAGSGDRSTSEVSLDNNPVEHYRDLFHDAPCPYFVMAVDGTLTEANKAFWRLINHPDGANKDINFRNLLSSAGAIYYDSQVLPSLLLSGTRNEVALDIRAKSGRKLVLANFALDHRNGPPGAIRAILLDASERREYEKGLLRARREAEQLAEVIHHSTDAVITLQPRGVVRNWNEGATKMFGYSGPEALGRSLSELIFREEGRESIAAALAEVASGREFSGETTGTHKDGTVVQISVKLTPHMEAPGALVAFSAILRDISVQKRAEQALLQSEKLASVGRLASSIAHEINNPLAAITNLLYILDSQVTTPEQKALVQSAQDELARVSQITSHTLRFHRQSSHPAKVDLAKLFVSVVALYRARLRNSEITAEISRCNAAPLYCHEGELRQIILNIVGNAVDAMKSGGKLTLRAREATQRASGQRGVRITIADNGTGMEKQTVARIFEPFFSTKGIGGTGLGLWVTQDLVEKNQGKLAVRSANTATVHGTVFTLFFPHDRIQPTN